MNLTIGAIALAAAAALGGLGSYKVTSLHYQHVIDQAAKKAQTDLDAANQRAQNAADDYEVWASLQRPKTITVTREINRAIQADMDCSRKPLPDSLRDALTAAGSNDGQPIANRAVPAPP